MTLKGGKMTIKPKHFFLILFAACFVVCFNGMAEVPNNPVAEVMVDSSGVHFMPRVNFARLDISLSRADGSVVQKTFNSGSTIYFDLSTILGERSSDGLYTYEMRVISAEVKISRGADGFSSNSRTHKSQDALTQTGYFTVRGGMIVTPGAVEPRNSLGISQDGLGGSQDQLILDDLIVDGSACIGFDCVNGESFGFDTLRLKENNLRIKFQDTSYSASFPSNDWQITANDSTNGGANKFSIDDIDSGKTPFTIEAGTRANAIYVDDSGRVGLGTSTPAEDLHIWYGDTPTIRLHQSGGGWAPQTWDVAGNEANFFIRDVTNGSELPFRIQPSAPTSSLCLMSDGKVGMGTWSPEFPLEIERTGENVIIQLERTDPGVQFKFAVTNSLAQIGSRTSHPLKFVVGNAAKMTIDTDGDVGIGNENPGYLLVVGANGTTYCDGNDWYPTSSRKYKENIRCLSTDKAMEALNGLSPVRYNYKSNKEEERVGFIAEDVPELVAINGGKNLNAMDILGVLTKVVQKQQKTISELKKEIADLKKK
jgi:hypothetical protein